jgi:hypothetical protein
MARSRTPLSVSAGGASSSWRAWASPKADVLPSLLLTLRRLTPSTGFPDSVALAEVIKERGQGRELAADAGARQAARFEVLAPGMT